MRAWLGIVFAMLLGVGGSTPAQTLTLGVTPLKSAARLAEEWQPLTEEIGRRAGIELVFRTAPNVPAFGERLAKGEYDIAFMNPYHYALVSAKPGYRAFARERDRPLVGIIVVRKDGPIRSIKDLSGQTVIFPTPLAFAASMLTQAELRHQGIHIDARYVQSHESVIHGVTSGGFVAGGTIAKIVASAEPGVASQLRDIYQTKAYHAHPFAIHPRLGKDLVMRLRAAFMSLNDDETGRRVLDRIAFKGIEPANDRDYDDARRLDMRALIEALD